MRRILSMTPAFAVGVAAVLAVPAGPAQADVPLSTSNQKYFLRHKSAGLYVTAEINDSGSHQGLLRARSTTRGAWETFTLHTNDAAKNVTLCSQANGYYVTAEIEDAGSDKGPPSDTPAPISASEPARSYTLTVWPLP